MRPQLAIALQIRWLRDDEGLTQAELAKRARIAQQQIARLEDPDANPTISTIESVAAALQTRLQIAFVGGLKISKAKPTKVRAKSKRRAEA